MWVAPTGSTPRPWRCRQTVHPSWNDWLPIRTAIHRNPISFHPIRKRSQSILLSTDKIHIHILDVTGTSREIPGSEFRLFYCDMDILHRTEVNPNWNVWTRYCQIYRWISLFQMRFICIQVTVKVILRPTVSRSVCLSWCQTPILNPRPNFLCLSFIIFRQLRVCSFQFFLGIASAAFLRSESHGTHEHILLSLFLRLPQPGSPGSCIYFPPGTG
jgi:hypothetical protein